MNSPWDFDTVHQIRYAMALANMAGDDPIQTVGVECANYAAAYDYALSKDCPAKTWWHLTYDHPAIARALRIDRMESVAGYALRPFRYIKRGERHLILAAWPCPHELGKIDMDWLGIETVLAWEPVTGKVTNLTDDRPQLFGAVTSEDATVYGEPRAFFTAWARKRAWFASAYQQAMTSTWSARPREIDQLPGGLAIGDIDAIHWPTPTLPERFTTVGIDPKALNRAILKSARLPFCTGTNAAHGTDIARAA